MTRDEREYNALLIRAIEEKIRSGTRHGRLTEAAFGAMLSALIWSAAAAAYWFHVRPPAVVPVLIAVPAVCSE
jgi:hypothetical protein